MDFTKQIGNYIGNKKIKNIELSDQVTHGGVNILVVTYKDDTQEQFSALMLAKVITERAIDASPLRDLRVTPVVAICLEVLRDWGIKMSELSYFATTLNQSLNYNHNQALLVLLSKWMIKPNDSEEIDLVTIDRILRDTKKPTENVQTK